MGEGEGSVNEPAGEGESIRRNERPVDKDRQEDGNGAPRLMAGRGSNQEVQGIVTCIF